MGILKQAIGRPKMGADFIGAESFETWNPGYSFLNKLHSDSYASAYPSIRAISNEFMTIQPYAINAKGEKVESVAVNALYHPNKQDSSVAFFEKLAVSTLAHSKTYVLVWHKEGRNAVPGGKITPNNIAGYTFLEYPAVTRRDGKTYYSIDADEFTENEVMVIPGGVDPKNLYGGYSPSEAARRWAKLDDYIADFQAGFFENGAVPAGQFVITAKTKTDFNDMVDTMQSRHRGAGKNGNVTYTHRPVNPNDDKPLESQIEWIPFAQSNKEIDFANLFAQTNRRIDVAFGVSAQVKGIDDSATYANAQVSEAGFAKRAVKPLALRIYTQITHELNRITNGLGVAITFTYDIPAVADEEKVRSETKNLDANLINTMVAAGFSLDTVVDAFELPKEYKLLKTGNASTPIEEDQTDVDEGGEVNSAPDPDKVDRDRVLYNGGSKGTNPKAELTDHQKIEAAARKLMQSQIDRAIEELDDEASNAAEPTTDEKQDFVDETLVVIVAILIAQGELQYAAGKALILEAGLSADTLNGYFLSDTARQSYETYLARVADSYGKDTAESIRTVLARANTDALNLSETKRELRNIVNTDEWRIKRLADTEMNRSQGIGSVEAMKQIEDETGALLEKSLNHPRGAECEYCKALEDVWVRVDQPLIGLNDSVVGVDGGIFLNNFAVNEGYDVHPNGKGTMIYRVVGLTNSVMQEIHCSHCDRFLGETDKPITARLKCSNTSCKKLDHPVLKEVKHGN